MCTQGNANGGVTPACTVMISTHHGKQNSLCFPCKISVFPVYFHNKITTFLNVTLSMSHFSVIIFFILNFQIPCVSCAFPVWNYFSPFSLFCLFFPVEWNLTVCVLRLSIRQGKKMCVQHEFYLDFPQLFHTHTAHKF